MTLPTFLIIGASKCGTTSLYAYLAQHPDVFMSSPKEPNFFNRDPADPRSDLPWSRRDGYEGLFAAGSGARARGEASAAYLWSPRAPGAIRDAIPAARLIVLLRDPVARAFSAWLHLRQRGLEPIGDFFDAVDAEAERSASEELSNLTRYVEAGRYHEQLQRWLSVFAVGQLQVHLTEDLERDPLTVVARCCEHIGVDAGFRPDTTIRHNRSGVARSPRLGRAIHGWGRSRLSAAVRAVVPRRTRASVRSSLQAANLRPAPPLPDDAYERLAPRFADDVARLRALLGRDLAEWPVVRFLDR